MMQECVHYSAMCRNGMIVTEQTEKQRGELEDEKELAQIMCRKEYLLTSVSIHKPFINE